LIKAQHNKGVEMRRKDIGSILMAVGILCGILFTLINLSGFASTETRGNSLLMYVAIIAILAGLTFYAISRTRAGD
jgi:hypothetical protein